MTRKEPRRGPGPKAPPRPAPGKKSRALGFAVIAIALIVAAGIVMYLLSRRPAGPLEFAASPQAIADTTTVRPADFMGSEVCGQCHVEEFGGWKSSTHAHAGGAPTPDRVIAPFNGAPMHFKDAIVVPSRAGSEYRFTVSREGQPPQTFRVDAVVGGGFMAGGGTQAFFSRFPDGTLRFLPFDYSRAANTWFCNTRSRTNKGGELITPAVALADCADWTPNRILGSTERFQGCQQCHGSQIGVEFSADLHRYDTHYTTLAINCESCHGPGRRHVELARSGKIRESADIGMASLETLTRDQSLQVCFQCHAVKSQLQAGYLPGKSFQRHYALKLPLVLDTIYYADGRTRTFAYQEGHLSSDCYLSGSMTCVDCHDPHTQHYRDINQTPLPGRFDNGQCLDCHPSKQPVEQHTHHPAASEGSRCTSCHMPYLQQPEVGNQIRYGRSDHTIPIPRPAFDNSLGVQNACSMCHRDRPVAQLQSDVDQWYGPIKPLRPTVSALVAADSVTDPARFADRVLLPESPDGMGVFHGLSDVLGRAVAPGAPRLASATARKTEDVARRDDFDLEGLALATLHLTRSDDRGVGRFITQRLEQLESRGVPVRARWVWILKSRGDLALRSGDYQGSIAAYQRASQLQSDDPMIPLNLGIALGRLGRFDEAIAQFRRSLELDPAQLQAMVNLGTTLFQRGDLAGAIGAFRSAIAMHPADPLGYANLGLTLARADSAAAAIPELEHAVSLDPSLADAHFVLGSAYASLGRFREAENEVRKGLEFDPGNPGAGQLLQEIQNRRKAG